MFALNTSPNSPIPYNPLPDNAYNAARDSIVNLGFSNNAILDEYSFSTQDGQLVKVNALAFAHPTQRTPKDYAGFTLYNATGNLDDPKLIQILAQTSAPFYLIHHHNRFSFLASNIQNNQAKLIPIHSDIDYSQLDSVLNEYAVDLKPQKIVDVKQGRTQFTHPSFADAGLQPLQLSLWAVDVTRPLLVRYFGQAVGELREYLKDENIIVDIATQLLGATILADRGDLGDDIRKYEQNLSLNRLIHAAQSRFPTYFKEQLFDNHFDIAYQAYNILRQIRYVSFEPTMLTEIYKQAYDEKRRKELGRYDTPLYLTQRIWENIPVEFLPPDQRVTVDMTCGWGSFLLSGYKRLSGLSDMQGISLREYIYGNDNEPLAARLAGLGLLISTSEDSWHVGAEDALEWDWLNKNQPNIIVGNPPFKSDKKKPEVEGKLHEKAVGFLNYAIDRLAPDGYLAMIMPQSFSVAQYAASLRPKLLRHCDIVELWDLPKGIFEGSANTMVIFAQKKAVRNIPIRVRNVQRYKKSLEAFRQSGIFTVSGLVSDQSVWNEESRSSKNNTHIMDYYLVLAENSWREIQSKNFKLSDRAIIFNGATYGQQTEKKKWQHYQFPKEVYWLTEARNVLTRPFYINYNHASKIRYPNDLWRPLKNEKNPDEDKEQFLTGKKVLLTSANNASWGRRVKVAIERKHHFVSNSFWVIVPTQESLNLNITHEVLAAVLNWYLSNAWIVEHLKYTWTQSRTLDQLPFPAHLSRTDCENLTQAVWQLEVAAIANQPEPAEVLQTIDTILKAAYQLDDETFERLRLIYEWDDNPQITLDIQPDPEAQWEISGIVEEVNVSKGTITLWLSNFDHFETVSISPIMPGWMLRPQAAFRTTIPRFCVQQRSLANVSWGKFYPQEYTYLAEEELFDQLTRSFYPETEII